MSERAATRVVVADVVVLVLAAGSSTRMKGLNKLLVRFDGVPLVRRTVQTIARAGFPRIVVALGHDAGAVAAAIGSPAPGLDTRLIEVPDYAQGQQRSVIAGLAATEPSVPAVMIVPADMPLLQAQDLADLVAAFARRPDGTEIVVPFFGTQRGNPVIVSRVAVDAVLASPRSGMRAYIDANPSRVHKYVVAHERFTVDVDSRDDLERVATSTGMDVDFKAP
jgi:CTP:molybdopterin cytidylyltransferase MocA